MTFFPSQGSEDPTKQRNSGVLSLSFFRKRILVTLFHRFRDLFGLFVHLADFLHRFVILSRVIVPRILQDN